jgi:hypothetical protein
MTTTDRRILNWPISQQPFVMIYRLVISPLHPCLQVYGFECNIYTAQRNVLWTCRYLNVYCARMFSYHTRNEIIQEVSWVQQPINL